MNSGRERGDDPCGRFRSPARQHVHGFKGASADGARVLIFAAPEHASEFFEEVNSEVRSLPDDLSKIPEIGVRHGIEFVSA